MSRTWLIACVARYMTDEVQQPVLEPAAGDVGRLEDARALADRDAPEDRRAVVGAGSG